MTNNKSEGKNWQQVTISATFAIILLFAGWLYSSYNERQKQLTDDLAAFKQGQYTVMSEQQSEIAVLKNETKNMKEILLRLEAAQSRVETKLDQAIRR